MSDSNKRKKKHIIEKTLASSLCAEYNKADTTCILFQYVRIVV